MPLRLHICCRVWMSLFFLHVPFLEQHVSESFYGSLPIFCANEITGVETGSWSHLLKYGAPCHPDVVVR